MNGLHATGGGAHKFNNLVNETLGLNMVKYDELLSLVNGYITMNQFETFYEKSNKGYKNVASSDLVIIKILFIKFRNFHIYLSILDQELAYLM